jgi:CheY-like chemotaxis protein/PAS domain-containing protein
MTDDQYTQGLKKEIATLQEAKRLGQQMADEQMQRLSSLADKLKNLNEVSTQHALGRLPGILQAVISDKNCGILVLDQTGNTLLFNPTMQFLLGSKNANEPQAQFQVFKEDTETLYPQGLLSPELCQSEQSQKVLIKQPQIPEGIWVRIYGVPLLDESGNKAGTILIVYDITEQEIIEQEIQRIWQSVEQQISVVQNAKAELSQLAQKLGNPDWASLELGFSADEAEPQGEENKLILVVDDLPVNRKLLVMQLEKLGYQVDQADDGKPAVEMVKKTEYGLVFMDIGMPEMDGYQATAEIRKYDLETKQHTPVVALTSYDREGDKEKCLSSGMDDYLSKGVPKKRLQEVLERCIRRKKPPSKAKAAEKPIDQLEVIVDIKQLEETYGKFETESIIELFMGTMKTIVGCLTFAIDERDAKSVNHFAYTLKGPCSTLGLQPMVKVTERMTTDAESGEWESTRKYLDLLQDQYKQVISQLSTVMPNAIR